MNKLLNKTKSIWKDRQANEAVTGLWVMLTLFFFCATLIFLILYISRYAYLSAACNHITRHLEVEGFYDTAYIDAYLTANFSTSENVTYSAYYLSDTGEKTPIVGDEKSELPFCKEFCFVLSARYTLRHLVFGAGDNSSYSVLNFHCTSIGMSEVFHKQGAGS